MENIAVSVKPDKSETREIIIRYTKVAAVILCNIVLFNIILKIPIYIIGGVSGGDFSSLSAMAKGYREYAASHEFVSTLLSVCIPIASEMISIILGILLLKIDLKKLFNRNGYTGVTLIGASAVSIGVQTISGFIALLVMALLKMFSLEMNTADITGSVNSAAANIIMYFYACFGAPLIEEVMYRGVILQGLRKYNERFAIVISSLLFGLMHQNIQQCILGILFGLVLGTLAVKTGSIIPTIVCHFAVNSSGVLMTLIIMNLKPDFFAKGTADILASSAEIAGNAPLMAVLLITIATRFAAIIAAAIIIIWQGTKSFGLKKATPAGKSRSWRIMFKTAAWYAVIAAYIYLTFIASVRIAVN